MIPSRTTHRDLLAAARRLQAAALADDDDALHLELCRLRNTFVDHARGEQEELAARGERAVARLRVVESGHRRLLAHIDALLAEVGTEAGDCPCHRRAVELTRELSRHALVETALFDRI